MEKNNIKDNPRIGVARTIARKLIADTGVINPPVLLGPIIDFLKKTPSLF